MGHERLGQLPKSNRWRRIVDAMASYDGSIAAATVIATSTLENVRHQLDALPQDVGVTAIVRFLVDIAKSQASGEAKMSAVAPISMAIELRRSIPPQLLTETGRIAQNAACDALAEYYASKGLQPGDMFSGPKPAERWAGLSTGAGFCELSKAFFARFTERYLNYFLEREASATIPSARGRELFHRAIEFKADTVAQHAIETAKIAQSFAAGWFNKRVSKKTISDAEIRTFVRVVSKKIREELRRELES